MSIRDLRIANRIAKEITGASSFPMRVSKTIRVSIRQGRRSISEMEHAVASTIKTTLEGSLLGGFEFDVSAHIVGSKPAGWLNNSFEYEVDVEIMIKVSPDLEDVLSRIRDISY